MVENQSVDRFVVPLSRAKIGLTLLGSAGFVAVCLWLWSRTAQTPLRDSIFMRTTAIVGIAFFGMCGFWALFKLFDATPGLVIDAEGIVDNASGVSAGRIPWSDIRGFHVTTSQGQRFLTVDVHNPQMYIQRANVLKRLAVSGNAKYFGSPIQISATALSIDFDELLSAANRFLDRSRSG